MEVGRKNAPNFSEIGHSAGAKQFIHHSSGNSGLYVPLFQPSGSLATFNAREHSGAGYGFFLSQAFLPGSVLIHTLACLHKAHPAQRRYPGHRIDIRLKVCIGLFTLCFL